MHCYSFLGLSAPIRSSYPWTIMNWYGDLVGFGYFLGELDKWYFVERLTSICSAHAKHYLLQIDFPDICYSLLHPLDKLKPFLVDPLALKNVVCLNQSVCDWIDAHFQWKSLHCLLGLQHITKLLSIPVILWIPDIPFISICGQSGKRKKKLKLNSRSMIKNSSIHWSTYLRPSIW